MTTPEPMIEARQLDKFYGDFHALNDVDLTVRKGEKMVICGPSGSGKSSFLKAGLLPMLESRVTVVFVGVRRQHGIPTAKVPVTPLS